MEEHAEADEPHMATLGERVSVNLSRRSKWPNSNDQPLKVDDIIWVLTDQTTRGIWPLGRVMETTPGRDGETRVVKVKTAYARTFAPFAVSHAFFLRSFFWIFSLRF